MNKKFLIGLSAAAVATTFMACGDGDVFELTNADMAIQFTYVEDDSALVSLRDNAMKDCSGDPACAQKMGSSALNPSNPSKPTSSASEDIPTPGPVNPLSSSSFMPTLISSSSIVFNPTSSEEPGEEPNIPTGEFKLGTCAPAKATINKGESTTWSFTLNTGNTGGVTGMDILDATFTWDFGAMGGAATSPATKTSSAVTYMNSGAATTTLKASFKGGLVSETITCAPLQVNGDPITGCKCEPAKDATDFLSEPDVTWTVTGCTTASMPLTYTWDGAAGETSFTKTFTAATPAYAPKLKVGNSDNTVIDVTCGSVKVTEGAEYTITDNQSKVEFPAAGKYNVVIGYACQNKTFYCNGNGGPVGGSVNGVAMTSSWYTTAGLTAADCSGSATVVVEVDGPASCGAQ